MKEKSNYRPLPNMEDHMCFGCSPINPHGLRMTFYTDGASLFSWVTVPDYMCSWRNLIHGGILCTILDEIMGRTVIHLVKKLGLTKSMTTDFIKPAYIGNTILAEGKVIKLNGERDAIIEGCIWNEKEELCAKGTGAFAILSLDYAKKRGIADDKSLSWFESMINA